MFIDPINKLIMFCDAFNIVVANSADFFFILHLRKYNIMKIIL